MSDDVDFEELAANDELSGGHIKNAVLRAAFPAAQEKAPIGFDQLDRAAALEAREMGMLVRQESGEVVGEAAADWASGFGGPPAGLTQGLRHVECAAGQLLVVDARAKAATLLNMD